MERRYRIIITGKKLYKEIEIAPESRQIRFGTENSCDIRVRKDLFFEPVELTFIKDDEEAWMIMCSDNLYFYTDDVRELMAIPIQHGSEYVVRYQKSSTEVLHVLFLIDFDYDRKTYNRRFDLSSLDRIFIGTDSKNQIIVAGPYTYRDQIVLQRDEEGYQLKVLETVYGVYHNGTLVTERAHIEEGDFFSVANYSFYYKNRKLFTQQSQGIRANGIQYTDSRSRGEYPKFKRNSRVQTILDETKIEVLDPPALPSKPKNNLLTRILPSVVMIIVSIIMGCTGGMFIIISLASAIVGIVTAIIGVRQTRQEYKKEFDNRIAKYNSYIEKKRSELNVLRTEELTSLQNMYISEEEEIKRLKEFSYKLFDRCAEDDDFLYVRLGVGNVEAKRKIEYKKQERLEIEDDLQIIPQQLSEDYQFIPRAPIMCDFKNANAIGIIGADNARFAIFKNIIVDICTRQYHSDIQIYFVAQEHYSKEMEWIRILPQVQNVVLGIRSIVSDESSRTIIYEYLYKELTVRSEQKIKQPHILVFLYDESGFMNHPISKFVNNAKELGATFVFFGNTRAHIGQGCSYLIENQEVGKAKLVYTRNNKTIDFSYKTVSDGDIMAMSQLLAPVYTEEISLESSLTKNITLFELLNIIAVEDIDLNQRWNNAKVYETMTVPIGISKTGVMELDLHDKAHGPHGLVAGTTGSGKSELLQTYIIAMATLYHPFEVGFVIIDFKGGGMANQFKNLPHLMGSITNIDGREINRSLRSIKAELKKRQYLFAQADVNHIDKYILKFRKGEVKKPLPHLILIVDEFAELKAEYPEFMKELISAARIGRSLGVHLILATQKPSGQVDEQIWSNSRFKLCLKVQTPQDSNEVLKSPLAAEIREPGRAYLQVGNNEIFELFQSAYSGAAEQIDVSSKKEFAIYEILPSGKRVSVYVQKYEQSDNESRTQLDAVTHYIKHYCDTHNIEKLSNICLPSLNNAIPFCESKENEGGTHVIVNIGIYDNPDDQKQDIYKVDLTNQNLMVIGSAQSGKTNLLQTIIRGVSSSYSPERVNIYILDFASMYLKNYENLKHVGGVVTASEDEKLKNFFKMIYVEMDIRREKLLQKGASSFVSYCEMGYCDMPHIILMIDNMTMLNELYLMDEDELLPICRDGISLGISIVLANAQTNGISYRYMSNFENKIALNCNDGTEYNNLFGYTQVRPLNVQGRALVEVQKEVYEAQIYQAFKGQKEYEKLESMKEFIKKTNEKYQSKAAKKIPVVPKNLTDSIFTNMYEVETDYREFYLGIDFEGIQPYKVDWIKQSILGISGKVGKDEFIEYMKYIFIKHQYKLYIIDDYRGAFEDVSECKCVQLYSRNVEDLDEILYDICMELERRQALRELHGLKAIEEEKPIILFIQNRDCVEYMDEHSRTSELYTSIFTKWKGLKCCVIFTNLENDKIPSYSTPEAWKPFNKSAQYIVFENIKDIKLFDTTNSLRQKYSKKLDLGECFVLNDNLFRKIKTIQVER